MALQINCSHQVVFFRELRRNALILAIAGSPKIIQWELVHYLQLAQTFNPLT